MRSELLCWAGGVSRVTFVELFPGLVRLPLIGILRGYETSAAVEAATIAHAGGLQVVEVTMDSPGASATVEEISRREPGLSVGVGTVTKPAQVMAAVDAGANFVVTPALSDDVVSQCLQAGVPVIPGATTPSEILRALDYGAAGVKVFPAEQIGGPGYIRAIATPLGHPPMVPTGGVTPDNAREYLDSGAVALGAGSSLFPRRVGLEGDWEALDGIVGNWMKALR